MYSKYSYFMWFKKKKKKGCKSKKIFLLQSKVPLKPTTAMLVQAKKKSNGSTAYSGM